MTPADTLSPALTQYTGTPGPDVTTWGIWRVHAGGKEERLRTMGHEGVQTDLWPLSELTIDEVRNRWGAGEYRCFWVVDDPSNPQPEARRRAGGRGKLFVIDGPPAMRYQVPTAPFQGAAPTTAMGEMERMIAMMGMVANMSSSLRAPPVVPDERNVDLAKEVAKLQATLEADRRLTEVKERHDKEVRGLEDALREERIRRRRAEDERDNGSAISLKDGEGLWDLLKKHVATNPGAALKQFTDVLRSAPALVTVVQKAAEAAAAAQQPPAPPPAAIARPRAMPSHLRAVPGAPDAPPIAAAPAAPPVAPQAPPDLAALAAEHGSPRTPAPA